MLRYSSDLGPLGVLNIFRQNLVSDHIKRKGTVIPSPQGLEHTSTCPAVDGVGNEANARYSTSTEVLTALPLTFGFSLFFSEAIQGV